MGILGATSGSELVVDLMLILGCAGLVALAMQRLKLPLIPAYLLTGLAIGPHSMGFVPQEGHVREIGDLAIVLLMFGIGMHLDWGLLRGRVRVLFTAGILAVVLCTGVLWPIALLAGVSSPSALVLAMAMSLSSTAVVVRILQQRMETSHRRGQISLAILVVQDLAVVAMLLVLPPIARWNGSFAVELGTSMEGWVMFLRRGMFAALGLTGLVIVGRLLLPRLLREAARMRSDEIMIVIATAFAIGASAVSTLLGLSPELGAFLAGFLLSGTQFKHHLGGQIATLRNLFIAVFFTTMGMYIDPMEIVGNLGYVFGGTALVLLAKFFAITFACWVVGASLRMSVVVGVSLVQAGEFSIIILGTSASAALGLIDERTLGLATSIVAISIALTPLLFDLSDVVARRLHVHFDAPWIRRDSLLDDETPGSPNEHAPHVVVAGFGVAGRAVTDRLVNAGRRVQIIELNPRTVSTQRDLGLRVVYGDVSNAEVLRSVDIEQAAALVLTMPDTESVLRACRLARQLNPDLYIIARTSFVGQSVRVRQAGADAVLAEEFVVARAMEQEIEKALQRLDAESAGATLADAEDSAESP